MGDVQQQLYKLTGDVGSVKARLNSHDETLADLKRRLDANGAKRWDVWKIVLNAVIAGAVSIVIALLVKR